MALRCRDGDLAVIVGEYPGCEVNIGRIVQVRGPAHYSEHCGDQICCKKMVNLYVPDTLISERVSWKSNIKHPDCWLLPIRPPKEDDDISQIESFLINQPETLIA